MFKCIAEGFKKRHLKNMEVKNERVLSFYNLDAAKKCVVFWVADDVPVSSVNKVREALAKTYGRLFACFYPAAQI